jgi:poly-gamma-glutamate synthesis protein (capsule biosynthesis protein)
LVVDHVLEQFDVETTTVRVDLEEPVPDLRDYDAVIFAGGEYRPEEFEEPIFQAERVRIMEALEADVPILGICLGHQLLAYWLGGDVQRGRWEFGWLPVEVNKAGQQDPLFAGLGETFYAFLWHGDQVTRLPEGAVLLASTERCPVQSFRLRDRPVWGVQFNPQYDPEIAEAVIRAAASLPEYGYDIEEMVATGYREYGDVAGEIFGQFLHVVAEGEAAVASPTPTPMEAPSTTATSLPPTPSSGLSLPLALDWQFNSNGHLADGLILDKEGQPLHILASHSRKVYALNADGEVMWRVRTAGPVYALTAMAGGQIAAGDDAGHITALDNDGAQLWQHDLGTRVTALQGSWQGGLLVGGWDERLTLLETEPGEGQVRWQVELGMGSGRSGPVTAIAALPVLAVVATSDGYIEAVDPTGASVWRYDAGAPVTGLGTVAGVEAPLVLAGLQDGRLLALDALAEEVRARWEYDVGTGGPVWHVANSAGDGAPEIVVGSGGTLPHLALLSADGRLLWRAATPARINAIVTLDIDGDATPEILAGMSSGEVQVYDGQGSLRGSAYAGLSLWGLEAGAGGPVLALADVVAWQLSSEDGLTGGPWLPPPEMVPAPSEGELASAGSIPIGGNAQTGAVVTFLGDVSPGRSMEAQLARYGPAHPWEGLAPLLQGADLAVANLESLLTTRGQPMDKDYLIRAHPQWGRMLAEGGLDLVTLANNHAFDFGRDALDQTLDTLAELGIETVGVGTAAEPGLAHRPAVYTLNGVRVAMLGYLADRWNGSEDVPATDRLAWAQVEAVQNDVRQARQQADVVIVQLHAGTEYEVEPSPDQVEVAHVAIHAGADLVVGHHAHVTQTVERYGDGLIVYGLGGAVFDIPRPAAMSGHLLRVLVSRDGLAQAELWPFWIEDAIRPRLLDDGQGAPRFDIIYPQGQ